jgi:streptogramin lyase
MADLKTLMGQAVEGYEPAPGGLERTRQRIARRRRQRRQLGAASTTLAIIAAVLVVALLTSRDASHTIASGPPTSRQPPTIASTRTVPVSGGLTDVAEGYGSLWAPGNGVVHRIDAQTGRTVLDVPVPGASDIRHVTTVAGSVWVTDTGTLQLTRIDPQTNHIVATIPLGVSPTGITPVGHTIWLTYTGPTSNGLIPVDPKTNRLGAAIKLNQAHDVVTSAAHNANTFWAVNTARQVTQIDVRTGRRSTLQRFPASLQGADIVAATPDALWFAGPDQIVRLDTKTLRQIGQPIPIPKAQQVVITPHAVWVLTSLNSTDGNHPGQLWELNPNDFVPIAPLPVGLTPVRLLVTGQNIWVANFTDSTITTITLGSAPSTFLPCGTIAASSQLPTAPQYVGATPTDAQRRAARAGQSLRVVGVDSVCYPTTADLNPHRVNVQLRRGHVVAATIG